MELVAKSILEFIIVIAIFSVLVFIGMKVSDKIQNSSSRFLNPEEFLPLEEVQTLKQVLYLILMALCFINLFYSISLFDNSWIYFVVFDLLLSLFIAVTIEKTSRINKIILLLLVPYGSLSFLLFDGISLTYVADLVHFLIFAYFIKYYYDRFQEYTFSNGLGVTVVLTFAIIFFSFFITQFAENKSALDSLVMVSNAFTSNGYAVLGNSIFGKLNSILLVWGGYIISGAGSATLTAAILIRKFNRRLDELENLLEDGGEE